MSSEELSTRPKMQLSKEKEGLAMAIFEQLEPKEAQFIKAYWENAGNGVKAYLAVRPDVKYSTAATEALKLLKKPHVKQALQEYQSLHVNESLVLSEMTRLGLYAEKDADRVKALAKVGEYIGLGNSKNQNAGRNGNVAIQINMGIPDKKIDIDV